MCSEKMRRRCAEMRGRRCVTTILTLSVRGTTTLAPPLVTRKAKLAQPRGETGGLGILYAGQMPRRPRPRATNVRDDWRQTKWDEDNDETSSLEEEDPLEAEALRKEQEEVGAEVVQEGTGGGFCCDPHTTFSNNYVPRGVVHGAVLSSSSRAGNGMPIVRMWSSSIEEVQKYRTKHRCQVLRSSAPRVQTSHRAPRTDLYRRSEGGRAWIGTHALVVHSGRRLAWPSPRWPGGAAPRSRSAEGVWQVRGAAP